MTHKKILVIKHGAFGDMITATGAFATIRRNHLNDHITLLTGPRFQELAASMGYFDAVKIDPRSYQPTEIWALYQFLTHEKFTRVYDLQNSLRTAFYFWLLRLSQDIDWSGIAYGCSHRQIRPDRELLPASKRFADQLTVAGLDLCGQEELLPEISWMQADASRFNLETHKYVLLVPGSSAKGLVKRWPARQYSELAKWLVEKNFVPVIIAGNEEQDVVREICASVPQVLDLINKTTISEIAALARSAKAAVGNDTGPTHLIAAAGCFTILPWSSFSEPEIYAPRGQHVTVVYEPDLSQLDIKKIQLILSDLLS